jgi:hypothetical protein
MIELLLVTIVVIVVVSVIKPGRTPPLQNPLVIERVGQYHITLAPQLNLAQGLIESVAKQLGNVSELAQNSATLCFEMSDPEATAHGKHFYLLAITQRNGMLYFQAISPLADDQETRSKEINEFAAKVLINISRKSDPDSLLDQRIVLAVQQVAQQYNAGISVL